MFKQNSKGCYYANPEIQEHYQDHAKHT